MEFAKLDSELSRALLRKNITDISYRVTCTKLFAVLIKGHADAQNDEF